MVPGEEAEVGGRGNENSVFVRSLLTIGLGNVGE